MNKYIQELYNELAKHRKLINRAIGKKIIPHINYHHYEVVRIIGEIRVAESEQNNLPILGIFNDPLSDVVGLMDFFNKTLPNEYIQKEEDFILKGE